jgi:hypothetical protein
MNKFIKEEKLKIIEMTDILVNSNKLYINNFID